MLDNINKNLSLKNLKDWFKVDGKWELVEEEWRGVVNFETHYEVSNFGRVKSLSRRVRCGHRGGFIDTKERIMRLSPDTSGYLSFGASKNDRSKSLKVHKEVAMAFMNHTPNGFVTVVDHIKKSLKLNNVFNLQLISNRENCTKERGEYVGVTWSNAAKRWRARTQIGGKERHIGLFDTRDEARDAYQRFYKELESGDSIEEVIQRIKGGRRTLTSKYRGVCWHPTKQRWASEVKFNNKIYWLGYYQIESEAGLVCLEIRDMLERDLLTKQRYAEIKAKYKIRNNKFGFGVSKATRGKPWRVTVSINKKNIYIGSYKNFIEATIIQRELYAKEIVKRYLSDPIKTYE